MDEYGWDETDWEGDEESPDETDPSQADEDLERFYEQFPLSKEDVDPDVVRELTERYTVADGDRSFFGEDPRELKIFRDIHGDESESLYTGPPRSVDEIHSVKDEVEFAIHVPHNDTLYELDLIVREIEEHNARYAEMADREFSNHPYHHEVFLTENIVDLNKVKRDVAAFKHYFRSVDRAIDQKLEKGEISSFQAQTLYLRLKEREGRFRRRMSLLSVGLTYEKLGLLSEDYDALIKSLTEGGEGLEDDEPHPL